VSGDTETEFNLGGTVVDCNVLDEGAGKISDVEVCVVNEEVALSALLVIEVLGLEGSGVSLLEFLLVSGTDFLLRGLLWLNWDVLSIDEADKGGNSESDCESSHYDIAKSI
jgi:hypothetical protein